MLPKVVVFWWFLNIDRKLHHDILTIKFIITIYGNVMKKITKSNNSQAVTKMKEEHAASNRIDKNVFDMIAVQNEFEKNIYRVEKKIFGTPGIFEFNSNNNDSKLQIPTSKYYIIDDVFKGYFTEIDEFRYSKLIITNSYNLLKVSLECGPFNATDFKLYCYVEQQIHDAIRKRDSRLFEKDGEIKISIGNANQISGSALGYKKAGKNQIEAIQRFLKKLKGLVITTTLKVEHMDFCGGVINAAELYRTVDYKPFEGYQYNRSTRIVRGVEETLKLEYWILPSIKYLENIDDYKNSRKVNKAVLNFIGNGAAKFLYRMICMHDNHNFIVIKYSKIAQMMNLHMYTTPSKIYEKLGKYFKEINEYYDGPVFFYNKENSSKEKYSKELPFEVKKTDDGFNIRCWINPFLTPRKTTKAALKGAGNDAAKNIEEKKSVVDEIVDQFWEDIEENGVSPNEYLHEFQFVLEAYAIEHDYKVRELEHLFMNRIKNNTITLKEIGKLTCKTLGVKDKYEAEKKLNEIITPVEELKVNVEDGLEWYE